MLPDRLYTGLRPDRRITTGGSARAAGKCQSRPPWASLILPDQKVQQIPRGHVRYSLNGRPDRPGRVCDPRPVLAAAAAPRSGATVNFQFRRRQQGRPAQIQALNPVSPEDQFRGQGRLLPIGVIANRIFPLLIAILTPGNWLTGLHCGHSARLPGEGWYRRRDPPGFSIPARYLARRAASSRRRRADPPMRIMAIQALKPLCA